MVTPPSWFFKETCVECDEEIEVEEPQTCYYTGLGSSCGDCPKGTNCFYPRVCEACEKEIQELDKLLAYRDRDTGRDTVFEL